MVFLRIFLPALVLLFVPVSLLPTIVARVAVRAVTMAFHILLRPLFPFFLAFSFSSFSFCFCFSASSLVFFFSSSSFRLCARRASNADSRSVILSYLPKSLEDLIIWLLWPSSIGPIWLRGKRILAFSTILGAPFHRGRKPEPLLFQGSLWHLQS